MQITQITVHAGRTFNHPYEQYSNFKPGVSLVATLDESDDPLKVTQDLQAKAETLVEDHKRNMLKSLHELQAMGEAQEELIRMGDAISRAQSRIDDLRKKYPKLN